MQKTGPQEHKQKPIFPLDDGLFLKYTLNEGRGLTLSQSFSERLSLGDGVDCMLFICYSFRSSRHAIEV